MKAKTPLYLVYSDNEYFFSPDNKATNLWIEGVPLQEDELLVNVKMTGENGDLITQPVDHASFVLKKRRLPRFGNQEGFEIGGHRVDASLLARQKARWYGEDLFLEKYGGKEFEEKIDKERIDFGDEGERYSVYVDEDDTLVWKGSQWVPVTEGMQTELFPLLKVRSIDTRLMHFDLWDVSGKGYFKLRILKSRESFIPKTLFQGFKFIGARTRSQFVFEVLEERLLLSPNDWLLRTDQGWKKLSTSQEIDDYVDRKQVGVLFILDGVKRVGGRQLLLGTLFNSTRTELQTC